MTVQDRISKRFLDLSSNLTILKIKIPTKENLLWIRHYLIQSDICYFEAKEHFASNNRRFFTKNQEFVLRDLKERYDLSYKILKFKARLN